MYVYNFSLIVKYLFLSMPLSVCNERRFCKNSPNHISKTKIFCIFALACK